MWYEIKGWNSFDVRVLIYLNYIYGFFYTISSSYLFVFDDDRVICYTGADDIVDGSSEA